MIGMIGIDNWVSTESTYPDMVKHLGNMSGEYYIFYIVLPIHRILYILKAYLMPSLIISLISLIFPIRKAQYVMASRLNETLQS